MVQALQSGGLLLSALYNMCSLLLFMNHIQLQVKAILKPTQGVTWTSGKKENEGGYGAIFLD